MAGIRLEAEKLVAAIVRATGRPADAFISALAAGISAALAGVTIPGGGGGGAVNSVTAGDGTTVTGTATDPVVNVGSTVLRTSGSYSNPSWLTALAASKLTGALPAISGALLTALDAANIATGTLNDARLSANVALTNVMTYFPNGISVDTSLDAGSSDLEIGSGTGAQWGRIWLSDAVKWFDGSFGHALRPSVATAARTWTLPDASGELLISTGSGAGLADLTVPVRLVGTQTITDGATHILWSGYLDSADYPTGRDLKLAITGSVSRSGPSGDFVLWDVAAAAAVASTVSLTSTSTAQPTPPAVTLGSGNKLYELKATLTGYASAPDALNLLSAILVVR